tara:strand:- start:13186 stop:13977 length:792 start_codon:yes stop_codon:yes gene_type:complete
VGPNRLTGGRLLDRHHAAGIVTRRIEIECPLWPRAFDGIRIAHISDFHIGDLLPMEKAMAVVEQLANERPDMICNTGDVIDLDCIDVGPLFRALQAIEPPLGNYLVLGNHDELDDPDRLRNIATASGITVLDDSTIRVVRNGDELTVGGIEWARTPQACRSRLDRTVGPDGVDLLLSHNPKAFDHAGELGIPLVLSGHTHGGQIARKDRPDANLAIAHRRSAGLYEHGDSRLFVTVGVGAWFPIRMNCPAEVAILTIRSAPAG